MQNRIGLNIHSERINGDLELLERDLKAIEQTGFDVAEIPVHGVDAVVNGHLRKGRATQVKKILDEFDLGYTVHAPDILNLKEFRYPEVQRRVFSASIQFTARIGAKTMVYHQGKLRSNIKPVTGGEAITEEEAREIEVQELVDLGKFAEAEGVTICVENVHSSLIHLVKMIEGVGEESVRICCDFAHSYINASTLGYDCLRPVRLAKPHIHHAHVNDNFGKGEAGLVPSYIEAMPMGIGDLHLPLGWGTIPYEDIFRIMTGYNGTYILELQERFFENGYRMLEEALKDLRDMLERTNTEEESAGQEDR